LKEIDYDPFTGLTTTFEYDHASDQTYIGYHQDASAILEANRLDRLDEEAHRRGAKEEWARYARVPVIVQMEWLTKYGVNFANPDHKKGWMKLLNSPDYAYCKTTSYHHDR